MRQSRRAQRRRKRANDEYNDRTPAEPGYADDAKEQDTEKTQACIWCAVPDLQPAWERFRPSAYEFVLWLEAAKQRRWQILPLQASEDPCVYAGCSGSALNIYYISTEKLVEDAFLDSEDLENNPAPVMERFDFGVIRGYRLKMLNLAWDKWKLNPRLKEAFNGFKASEQYWLDEWAESGPQGTL